MTFCTWLSCLDQKEKQQIKQVQKTIKNTVQFTGLFMRHDYFDFLRLAWVGLAPVFDSRNTEERKGQLVIKNIQHLWSFTTNVFALLRFNDLYFFPYSYSFYIHFNFTSHLL